MSIKGKNNNKKTTSKVKSSSNKENKKVNTKDINRNLLLDKLIVGILVIIDIVLIICFAQDNYVNYAKVDGETIFIGNTRNLLFGRNYIGLLVTLFMFSYFMLIDKCYFKNKFNWKKVLVIFIGILLFNMLVFSLFINKIY